MKNIFSLFTFSLFALCVSFFGATPFALADTGLINVTFQNTPLFSNDDIKPGDTITKTVTVENVSGSPQDVYVELLNCTETKNLGDTLFMTVKDGSTTFVSSASFADLFCNIKKPLTSGLPAGASVTYDVTVDFPWEAGNEYQLGSAGFDFCVGFSGGAFGCDGSEETGEDDGGGETITPSGGGSDSGPSSSSRRRLIITDERPLNVDNPSGSSDLVWLTNLPATSKAVCRPAGTSVVFDIGDTDDFGYPIVLPEDPALIETHMLEMDGLLPGTYYCRVASRLGPGSGWTVSDEFPFTIGAGEETGTGGDVPIIPFAGGAVPGASAFTAGGTAGAGETPEEAEENTVSETDEANDQSFGQAAAAFLGIPNFADLFNFGVCGNEWWIWLVVGTLMLVATLWRERFVYAIGVVPEVVWRFWILAGINGVTFLLAVIFNWSSFLVPFGVGVGALFVVGILDAFLMRHTLPVYRLLYDTFAIVAGLVVALIVVLIMPWLCSIVPLIIITILMLVRALWHFFRMRTKDDAKTV